jgi:hypothetical protein
MAAPDGVAAVVIVEGEDDLVLAGPPTEVALPVPVLGTGGGVLL